MSKQTAVEWLIKQINPYELSAHEEVFKNALEMEKQQMIDFHIETMKWGLLEEGGRKWSDDYLPKVKEVAESHYKIIFKSE